MLVTNYLKESLLSILCFLIQGKGSDPELQGEIYLSLVAYGFFDMGCVASLHTLSQIGIFSLYFSKSFGWKGFYEIFCLCGFIDVLYLSLTNLHMWVEISLASIQQSLVSSRNAPL